ncbi:MAG: hypothetical protein E7560_02050 [Ruminococcaceae bacterium]|nr:hypothetical protein [Oscillospiraceae bacterium]
MFLKRFAAIVIALVLLVQLTACRDEAVHTSTNDPHQNTSLQTESTTQNADDANQDNSKDEDKNDNKDAASSGITSSGDNKNPSSSQQTVSKDDTVSDDKQEVGGSQQGSGNNTPTVNCSHGNSDPYQNISKSTFYANYKVACCNLDATYRSKHGLLSGSPDVPGQYAEESKNRPTNSGKFIRNTATVYLDNGNTYVVMDANGKEAMRIHKAGGYITLEEIAAYMYAFGGSGQIPANYVSKKSGKPNSSIWGEYLRLNHSYFLGDTNKYPYEPELPNISGCGGSLGYYEMDIGTTGTVTPGYAAKPYVDGNKINRGAARLVYARQDLNGNGIYENNEVYVFYTHNHYNDFREYLNYFGGWGKMFGNITGGGEYSSETNAKPTPYVETAYKNFPLQ